MTTERKQKELAYYLFRDVIDWISENLDPDDVFTKEQLDEWANNNDWIDDPEAWADMNGYIQSNE